jgi:hypothetical protein
MQMIERYSPETLRRTATHIEKRFHVSMARAEQLAVAALDGIDAHGLDPEDWDTVLATVNVVVRSWISNDAAK